MYVAIIIKNTILVILIILIGHFLVKNFLLDKKYKSANTTYKTEPNKDIGGALVPLKNTIVPAPIVPDSETPIAKPSSSVIETVQGGLDKAKEELLKFIDSDDDGNVDSFFGHDKVLPSQPTDDCKLKGIDIMLPLSTTCDQSIQSLSKVDKVLKSSGHITNTQKNLMMVNEYENENTMNGGELFAGLSAFDAFDNTYQSL